MKRVLAIGAISLVIGVAIGAGGVVWVQSRTTEGVALASLARGFRALEGKDYGEASRWLNKAANMRPSWYEPHLHLGELYEALGLAKMALEEYEVALGRLSSADKSKNLERAVISSRIGKLQIREHRYRDAVEALQVGITFFPDWPDLYRALADAYVKAGERGKAIESLREFLRRENNPAHESERQEARAILKNLESQR